MRRKGFRLTRRLWRALVVGWVAVLVFGSGAGTAGAAVAVPLTGGVDLSVLDPRLIAEMDQVEARVLEEEQQAQQLQQQEQQNASQIQANNQQADSVNQQISAWNTQADSLNQQAAALEQRIEAHNAEPHTFQLPDQEAEAQAYQAEADELQSEQSQLESQQSTLNQQQSAISAEQNQVQTQAQQLNNAKQQLDQQVTALNTETEQLAAQVQQLLQQIVSALQTAQQDDGTQLAPAAGGDQGRPADTGADGSVDDGQAGDDGGDPSSPTTVDDALEKYGAENGVAVDPQPVQVLLSPATVTRLSPGTAAELSPYRTYDGLVPNPDGLSYTALEVVAPGAAPDPFAQAINQGGGATAEVDGKPVVITRVQTVPGGRVGPAAPTVPAVAPAIVALLQDNGRAEQPDSPTSADQDDDPLPYGAEMPRPLPWETSTDPANKPRERPQRCTDNWQDYGPLQTVTFDGATGQRATGAEACVVSTSDIGRASLGFALFGLHTDEGMARCHLIGHNLNGSDTELGNFVPCYQNPTNNAWMYWQFEYRIELQVDAGDPVYLAVRPIYQGQDPLPIGLLGFAYSNKGWQCETFIPNVTQDQATSLGPLFEGC